MDTTKAGEPITPEALLSQLKQFNNEPSTDIDDGERQQLIYELRKSAALIETPFEAMQRVFYSVCVGCGQAKGAIEH